MEARAEPTPSGFSDRYRSSATRAMVASVLLAVSGLAALWGLVHVVSGFGLLDSARQGTLTEAAAIAFDNTTLSIGLVRLVLIVLTIITWLAWQSRAVDNVPSLGGGRPRWSPRWSIGWWFVPIMNLFRPYQIVRDLSDRMATATLAGGGTLVLAWWLTYVLGDFAGRVIARIEPPGTLDGLSTYFAALAVTDVLAVVAAGLAILVIRQIQVRAEARAGEAGGVAPGPVAAPADVEAG
jgi:Domain of unknown function (DUF4328)